MERKIKKSDLQTLYKSADANSKLLLEQMYTKELFKDPEITEIVGGVEDACRVLGRDFDQWFGTTVQRVLTKDELAYRRIKFVIAAINLLNNDWYADLSNPNQQKWYPYFIWKQRQNSGFGLSLRVTGYYFSLTGVVSRLSVGEKAHAEYVATILEQEYNDFFL